MNDTSDPFNGYEFRPYRAFSAEQHRQLAVVCKIHDSETHGKLLDTMADVSELYPMRRDFEKFFGPLGAHRDRLERIAVAASTLGSLLAEEPLADHLLCGLSQKENWTDRLQEADRIHSALVNAMKHLADGAGAFASDTDQLRSFRMDPKNEAKSVERREIWEPVFRLWRELGREPGYSDNGPLMTVLQIMHAALGLEPPNPYSVRAALRAEKAGGVLRVVK